MIDLDLLVPEDIATPWPVNLRRRWLVAGTFLLVLLFASGATIPARPGLPLVRTATLVNTASYRILGDALYITEARPDGNWVTAYPLGPGPARWTTQVANLADAIGMEAVSDVIVVGLFQVNVAGDHTVALDRRTGVVRWHSRLNLAAVDRVRGRAVLTGFPAAGLGNGAPSARIEVRVAGTGQLVWDYLRDGSCQADLSYYVDRPGTGLPLLCRDGSLTLLDLGTGQVRASVRAPVALGPRVVGLPDRVLVTYPSAGGTVLLSYDQGGLRQQWATTVQAGNYGIQDCGPRICLGDSVAEVALDRVTGKIVWQVRPIGFASPLTDRYVLVAPAGLGDIELVDVGTGRLIMQLGSWTAESAPVGLPMFYQSDGATGRTWVARLGLGAGAIEVLGFVPNARAETCVSNGGYLVCRTVKDTIAVWRDRTG